MMHPPSLRNPAYKMVRDGHKTFLENYDQMQHFTDPNDPDGNYQAYYDCDFDVLYYAKADAMHYGGENVTSQLLCIWRFIFLRDVLLKGQDSEFNIYRSYYLDPLEGKIAMAVLSLGLQIVLTVALSHYVYMRWELIWEQDDPLIITTSIMAFCFISYSTNGTMNLFRRFYKDIGLAYELPLFLLVCDYVSNIVLASYICCLSLFFLLQTQDYEDLVLNSMALTFIIELDDVINIYDSDEEVVIMADLRSFAKTNCESPRKIQYWARDFGGILFAPMLVLYTFWVVVEQFYKLFIKRGHRMRMHYRKEMMKRMKHVHAVSS